MYALHCICRASLRAGSSEFVLTFIVSIGGAARPYRKGDVMLYWAAVFFVIALAAAVLGFGGIATGVVEMAKILFFIFLIILVVTAILGLTRRG